MPIIGDRVIIDNSMGEVPIIRTMLPLNSDYIPYLDPGELGHQSESGSFVHVKNRRKSIVSTGQLIDYDATMGPNGETDLQYEAGGVIMRARSKQQQDQVYSKFDDHAHVAVFDNGDVVIQSMNKNVPKGLLHMDGMSGHTWLHAGDSKVQEYLELNPVKQEIVLFSDGDIHLFSQNDQKISTYTDQIVNVCGAWQFKTGVPTANIPSDFDQIVLDGDLNAGDIRIDNTGTQGAKLYLHISGDFDITVDQGNVNLLAVQGDVNVVVNQGKLYALAQYDVDIGSNSGDINLTSNTGSIILNAQTISLNAQESMTSYSNGPTTIGSGGPLTLSGNPVDIT